MIGENVIIGNFCTIHDNVKIGNNSIIEDYCTIGYPTPLAEGAPLIIGENSLIRSYSIFYEGSVFGNQLKTGHRVTVREKTICGDGLHIGTLCDIQGHCKIGNYVRFHSNVHIGQKSIIHDFVWIFPHSVLTNDPHPPSCDFLRGVEIFEYAVIATMSCILPGIKIGKHSLIGAHSQVTKDVPEKSVAFGVPAEIKCNIQDIKFKDGSGISVYPWTNHFTRGYPPHIIEKWNKGDIDF
ncbi:MAG: N-acetyltransferase [Desulfobacteraceae bacterium]|nr:N-acetyltransferase [Desulfobacteraceae bacterium]